MSHVHTDTWLLICAYAYRSPHAVFRLMMASKAVRDAIRAQPPQWWLGFYRSVCTYQGTLRHSNTLRRLNIYATARTGLTPAHILRAVFSPRCEMCGCTQNHRLLKGFALRVCGACLRTHLVSNVALAREYGLSLCDIVEPYMRQPQSLMFALDGFVPRLQALERLTAEPLELFDVRRRTCYFFLWRPTLERMLGSSLDALRQRFAPFRQAAALLSAVARRRHVFASTAAAAASSGLICVHVRLRMRTPLTPHYLWFPGGPFHSVSGLSRLSQRRVRRLFVLLTVKCVRSLSWFPSPPPRRVTLSI